MPLYLFFYRAVPMTAMIIIIWQFIMLIRIFRTVCAQCHFSDACRFNALQALFVKLSHFKLSTTFRDFIYVGNTACNIIHSQVLIRVLIFMKVSDSHLYHIWYNISRAIQVYVEWTKNHWFCMCVSILLCNIPIRWKWWQNMLCHNPPH